MTDVNLILVCATAFGAVFVLLTFLALAIQLITVLFPEPAPQIEQADEPAMVAAISVAVAHAFPGARVVRIEEQL